MTKLVQISSPIFSTTLRQCHVGCRLGQVLKVWENAKIHTKKSKYRL